MESTTKTLIDRIGTWAGVAVSICTLCLLVWRDGVRAQVQADQERRITKLENSGSGLLHEHVALDDEREKAKELRITRLEKIVEGLPEMQADIREIKVTIKQLVK